MTMQAAPIVERPHLADRVCGDQTPCFTDTLPASRSLRRSDIADERVAGCSRWA
jgi:hypothetical protein